MNSMSISRIIGLILLVVLRMIIPLNMFMFFVSFLAITHYAMSFYYSWGMAKSVYHFDKRVVGYLIIATIISMYFNTPSIYVLFGIHYVFSEYYGEEKNKSIPEYYYVLRLLLIVGFYVICLNKKFVLLKNIESLYLYMSLYLVYGVMTAKYLLRKQLTSSFVISEIVGVIIFAVFIYFKRYSFLEVVAFHFLSWLPYPYLKMKANDKKIKYVRETLVTFFITATIGLILYQIIGQKYHVISNYALSLMIFFGYIHIYMSFIVSKHNPSLLLKISGHSQGGV